VIVIFPLKQLYTSV